MSDIHEDEAKPPEKPRRRGSGWLFCGQVIAGLILLLVFAWWYLQIDPAYLLAAGSDSGTRSASGVRPDKTLKQDFDADLAAGKAASLLANELPSFHVESTNAAIGGMNCELLLLDASDVEFNVEDVLKGEKARIMSFGSANVSIRISDNELKSYLIPQFEKEGLRDVHIEFGAGTVKVTARRRVRPFGRVKMSAKGQFYIVGESGIGLRLREFESGQFNIGISKLKYSAEQNIPPLDLGGSFAKVVIDNFSITSKHLQIDAHAEKLQGESAPKDAIDVF